MARARFQPYTIEITKKLDSAEADESAAKEFRDNPFGDEDAIMEAIVGPQLAASDRTILWGRFGQFVQKIGLEGHGFRETPVRTEELTRRYQIRAA